VGTIQQSVTSVDPDALVGFPVSARTGRRTDGGASAHRDGIAPIEFLAARFPVIRRLVGEPSFASWRVASSSANRQAFRFRLIMARTSRASFEARAMLHRSNTLRTSPSSRWREGGLTAPPTSGRLAHRPYRRYGPSGSMGCGSRCILRCAWSNRVSRSSRFGRTTNPMTRTT
jgi:hypothetical protein